MEDLQQSIIRLDQEVEDAKKSVREAREAVTDYITELDEYKEVERLTNELKVAKAQLKASLMSDGEYNVLKSELEERKFTAKDVKEILSSHLVLYRIQNDRDVVVNENMQKPIILNGKLGKAEPENVRLNLEGNK